MILRLDLVIMLAHLGHFFRELAKTSTRKIMNC